MVTGMKDLFECLPTVPLNWIASVVPDRADIEAITIEQEWLDVGLVNGFPHKVAGPHRTLTLTCKNGASFTQVFRKVAQGKWEEEEVHRSADHY